MRRKCITLSLSAPLLALALLRTAKGDDLVWADFGPNALYGAAANGSNVRTILMAPGGNVIGVAVDSVHQQVYWTENLTASIRRANLDGTGVQQLWAGSVGGSGPEHIALDVAGGKMYWTDDVADRVRRANLDGSNVQDLVTGAGDAYGIALDLAHQKMYWADFTGARLMRANLDGTGVETVMSGGAAPYTVALDPVSSRAYFTTFIFGTGGNMTIDRVNFDGAGRQTIVSELGFPRGIALNAADGLMYWTDDLHNVIRVAGLDGTDAHTVISDLSAPSAIVFVPEPSSAVLCLCGGVLCQRRRRI